jgi:hypothetical protein
VARLLLRQLPVGQKDKQTQGEIMSHFAQINSDNIVTQVIVIEQQTLNSGLWGDPNSWIQTSYNTRGGVHYGQDGQPDGGIALRKNYAGIGFTYDRGRDAFIPPQPFPSWVLDEDTCLWNAPVPYPADGGSYTWDEDTLSWLLVNPQ